MTEAWDHPTHLQAHRNEVSDQAVLVPLMLRRHLLALRRVSKAALLCGGARPSPSAERGRGWLGQVVSLSSGGPAVTK